MTVKETPRATTRPQGFAKPAHWSNDPAPEPAALDETALHGDGDHTAGDVDEDGAALGDKKVSPTRYGDWTKDGIAVDF